MLNHSHPCRCGRCSSGRHDFYRVPEVVVSVFVVTMVRGGTHARRARITVSDPEVATHNTSMYVLQDVMPKDCIKESCRAFRIVRASQGDVTENRM